jgi:hypothetical protein
MSNRIDLEKMSIDGSRIKGIGDISELAIIDLIDRALLSEAREKLLELFERERERELSSARDSKNKMPSVQK